MDILQIKNLNLGFVGENGFNQALFNVNFTLKQGEMHALVGESGCGKSITAMSILKLLPKNSQITSGEIIFDNKDLIKLSPKEFVHIRGEKIALIPQDPMTSLNPLFTIGDQLLEVLSIHQGIKGKEAEKKAIEALDIVRIPSAKSRLKSYPHEFSGGMKQRAIIAMALCCEAEILIADEPTTALDVTIQAQIMNLLNTIKKEKNTSIILITHDLGVVYENADRISVMYAGRIVEEAPSQDFFKNTNHPYSKALLNSIPSSDKSKLLTIAGQPPTIMQNIPGCRFNPRCNFAMDICKSKIPELSEISPCHFSACFLNNNLY